MRTTKLAAGAALLLAATAPGLAAPKKGEPGYDPNREICKSKPVVGSRLKRVRECATAAQWEEMKLQERQGLLRRQTNGDPGGVPVPAGGRDTPW
ncbi:MAG TPA: hypothetical protein VEA60_06760 [Allosphingosinicella sp.]|nr:hypothetical protein [Allosphingosinicella sp.]